MESCRNRTLLVLINKAVEKKYKIVEIFEIYDYKQGKQIFGEYVNTFLKIKQESSSVPKDCLKEDGRVNEQHLDNFVKDFQRVEGVLLEKEKIQKNPALRRIAKKLLNSLWGKLAQNDNSVVVDFLNDYEELAEMLKDNTLELTSIDFISDNIARCTHKTKLSTSIYLENRNILVASVVMSYARFKLLDKIGENVLYFDKDSVLFVFDKTKSEKIETGIFLGKLTNELEKKNCSEIWIEEFCSTGPKCYSYMTKEY